MTGDPDQVWTVLRNITEPSSFDDGVEVPWAYGPFLPVTQRDVDVFNDALSGELDSAFSSSIGCCDLCYDDFRARWPDVTFRRNGAELQSMDTFWAVDESRLSGSWAPAEYSTLRRLVQCPRCDEFGAANIHLFEHRFSGAAEMERDVIELTKLGSATPFLLLEHPLAQRVLAEIRAIGTRITTEVPKKPLYRARLEADVSRLNQEPSELVTYGPAPAAFAGEGRFNHAGAPMLYLADTEAVAAAELGVIGDACLVGEVTILAPLKVFDLIDADGDAVESDLFDALANSALLAAPRTGDGWVKRQYVFSRFVGDCARSAGFDAIRYGSTKDPRGVNYVILDPPEDVTSLLRLDGFNTTVCPSPARRY